MLGDTDLVGDYEVQRRSRRVAKGHIGLERYRRVESEGSHQICPLRISFPVIVVIAGFLRLHL